MGAVAGSLLHLLIKVPALLYYGFRWWPILDAPHHAVRRVAVLMGPRVLDLALFQLTLLATTNLASRLAPGSVSAVEWGWDAMQLPETIIGTAFGVVAFPTLAELAARGDRDGLRSALADSLRMMLVLAVPATIGLIMLGRPLIQTLYQRGAFDSQATDAVYVALRFFALGLVGHCCLELAARAFFAQKDTVTPLLVAAGSAGLNIALGVVLMQPLAHGGLALANSIAVTAEVGVLLALLSWRLEGIEGRETLGMLVRVLAASLIMAVAIGAVKLGMSRAGADGLAAALLAAAAGAGVYVIVSLMLGVDELRALAAALTPARRSSLARSLAGDPQE
jgi:putative peptidoglycan lipid II flippase